MPEHKQRQGRGCFFYGCLTLILVFIGVMAGVYFGTRQAVKLAVQTYTSNSPVEVTASILSDSEQQAVVKTVEQQASAAVRTGGSVILGEKELNALVATSPELAPYRKQIYLQPEGDRLKARLSIPLDQFELWKDISRRLLVRSLTNRYFNGTAVLNTGVTNGTLNVSIHDLIVSGKSLPGEFTGRLERQNLAAEATKDPETRQILEKIDHLEIRDGKIHVSFKPGSAGL
jgi:hypothetical protein